MYFLLNFIGTFLLSTYKGQCKFFKVFEFPLIINDGEFEHISVYALA